MQASGNVAGLCSWAQAMVTYHKVAQEVEPKIQTLRTAEAELYIATKEKNAAEAELAIVQSKLDDMQARSFFTPDFFKFTIGMCESLSLWPAWEPC